MKLTADEIKLVVFALLALLVGAAAKHYRTAHPIHLPPPPASPAPRAPLESE